MMNNLCIQSSIYSALNLIITCIEVNSTLIRIHTCLTVQSAKLVTVQFTGHKFKLLAFIILSAQSTGSVIGTTAWLICRPWKELHLPFIVLKWSCN